VGIPMGLWLAEGNLHFYSLSGWHLPFFALGILSALIVVVVAFVMPPLRGHMAHATDEHPIARTWAVMSHPDHQKAFVFMSVLTCAGFCVFPQIPDYMVSNVGVKDSQLFLIYVFGGVCTLFSMNWVGRWADRSGKLRVFVITSLTTTVPILLMTNLPRVPLWVAIAVSTLLMVCMSNRMVPAMAMMTGAVEARYRGGFMSINASVQQLSVGAASLATGQILGVNDKGEITRFWINGLISVACVLGCIYLARFLKAPPKTEQVAEPMVLETL
jgi:predicted MFS family arabinose efflux permease